MRHGNPLCFVYILRIGAWPIDCPVNRGNVLRHELGVEEQNETQQPHEPRLALVASFDPSFIGIRCDLIPYLLLRLGHLKTPASNQSPIKPDL